MYGYVDSTRVCSPSFFVFRANLTKSHQTTKSIQPQTREDKLYQKSFFPSRPVPLNSLPRQGEVCWRGHSTSHKPIHDSYLLQARHIEDPVYFSWSVWSKSSSTPALSDTQNNIFRNIRNNEASLTSSHILDPYYHFSLK